MFGFERARISEQDWDEAQARIRGLVKFVGKLEDADKILTSKFDALCLLIDEVRAAQKSAARNPADPPAENSPPVSDQSAVPVSTPMPGYV